MDVLTPKPIQIRVRQQATNETSTARCGKLKKIGKGNSMTIKNSVFTALHTQKQWQITQTLNQKKRRPLPVTALSPTARPLCPTVSPNFYKPNAALLVRSTITCPRNACCLKKNVNMFLILTKNHYVGSQWARISWRKNDKKLWTELVDNKIKPFGLNHYLKQHFSMIVSGYDYLWSKYQNKYHD